MELAVPYAPCTHVPHLTAAPFIQAHPLTRSFSENRRSEQDNAEGSSSGSSMRVGKAPNVHRPFHCLAAAVGIHGDVHNAALVWVTFGTCRWPSLLTCTLVSHVHALPVTHVCHHMSHLGHGGMPALRGCAGVSRFMPTSHRLVQFSTGRSAPAGATIVYIDGAFDMFHTGHVDILRVGPQDSRIGSA